MDDLELQFKRAMAKADLEVKDLGYRATRFLQMVNRYGELGAVRKVLAGGHHYEGLTKLWELGRLDLSVEALVLKPEYKKLFNKTERETARQRLTKLGYFN